MSLKTIIPFSVYDEVACMPLYGFTNMAGEILLKPKFDEKPRQLDENGIYYSLGVTKNKKNLSVIISEKEVVSGDIGFDLYSIEYIGENYVRATIDDKHVFFNLITKELTITEYDRIYKFINGYVLVEKDEKYMFLDKNLKNTSGNIFDSVRKIENTLPPTDKSMHAMKDGIHYIIDNSGKIISRGFKEIELYTSGFLIVKDGEADIYINDEGKEICVPEGVHYQFSHNHIEKYYEDRCELCDKNGNLLFLTKGGFYLKIGKIYLFSNWHDNPKYYIVIPGKVDTDFNYTKFDFYYEDMIILTDLKGKKFLVDGESGVISDVNQYSEIWNFNCGIARVKKNNKYGFINRRGELICECVYCHATDFQNGGFAEVEEEKNEEVIINTEGKIIFDKFIQYKSYLLENPDEEIKYDLSLIKLLERKSKKEIMYLLRNVDMRDVTHFLCYIESSKYKNGDKIIDKVHSCLSKRVSEMLYEMREAEKTRWRRFFEEEEMEKWRNILKSDIKKQIIEEENNRKAREEERAKQREKSDEPLIREKKSDVREEDEFDLLLKKGFSSEVEKYKKISKFMMIKRDEDGMLALESYLERMEGMELYKYFIHNAIDDIDRKGLIYERLEAVKKSVMEENIRNYYKFLGLFFALCSETCRKRKMIKLIQVFLTDHEIDNSDIEETFLEFKIYKPDDIYKYFEELKQENYTLNEVKGSFYRLLAVCGYFFMVNLYMWDYIPTIFDKKKSELLKEFTQRCKELNVGDDFTRGVEMVFIDKIEAKEIIKYFDKRMTEYMKDFDERYKFIKEFSSGL